ncbi:MAG: hypothetical protein WAW36_13930 [Methylovulum miyakonense]|uniref:hypothetical protein n=1 Tax=Methylovulum miyakonense TaxID=645578 RepID=UPI003BB58102
MINNNHVDLVIQFSLLVAGEGDDNFSRQLGPIHLIKYAYLADISFAKRNNGLSFTGIDWQFYNFGPWSQVVHSRIDPALNAIHANKKQFPSDYEDKDDWVRWDLPDSRLLYDKRRLLLPAITMDLTQYIRKFGKDTPSLLDFVYKTKPMLSAAPNEYLELSLEVDNTQTDKQSSPPLRMDNLSNKKKKELQQKMAALRELHKQRKSDTPKLINPVPNPRYDEVYQEGVVWLESLSGEPLPSGNISVEFSNDVWKSITRKGENVS